MHGQDTPNDVAIDRDSERQSDLLSDARATPEGITLLGSDDRSNQFFGRTLGAGFAATFRGKEQVVLALDQDLVKAQ